ATGGTSAVYGSDAVAGVVNIILKNHFEGVQVHLQNMISSRGDAANQLATITAGTAFAGGRGHIVVNAMYANDHGLRSADRAYSRLDSPSFSSFAQQGLYNTSGTAAFSVAAGKTYTFDPNNNVKLYQGAGIDGYNRAADRLLSIPVKRYGASLLA